MSDATRQWKIGKLNKANFSLNISVFISDLELYAYPVSILTFSILLLSTPKMLRSRIEQYIIDELRWMIEHQWKLDLRSSNSLANGSSSTTANDIKASSSISTAKIDPRSLKRTLSPKMQEHMIKSNKESQTDILAMEENKALVIPNQT